MENMFQNMEFSRKLSPADIAMNIPKEYQMMSPEWCAGYLKGYREGVNKEREAHKLPKLEDIYPEHFKDKAIAENGKRKVVKNNRSWVMTAETLECRDDEVRNSLIVDIYKLTYKHIIERYETCYTAALIVSLGALGWREKRVNRIVDSLVKQLEELGKYVSRQDDNAIAKWCSRHEIPEEVMQKIFMTTKQYRFEDTFGIDDLEIFSAEE